MIRRILIVGGVGLTLAGGARFGLRFLTERAWEARKAELLEQALFLPKERRPWEIKFESMQERARTSPTFSQLEDSEHRPAAASWDGAARPLDELERLWVEGMLAELHGLEPVLKELRGLELEDLEWHGPTVKLLFLRECADALCGRAWIACEAGDGATAGRTYADALRLARATDDGTSMGTMIRHACESIVLRSLRSSLGLRPSVAPLRAALVPLLEGWAYDPARAERCIRRDLSYVDGLEERGELWNDAAGRLKWFEPVEDALALAREPVAKTPWVHADARHDADVAPSPQDTWTIALRLLHGSHAQRNVALTTLAVASWREEHGVYPATLAEVDDLPAEHALDPLTGEPLTYALEDGAARVGPAAWGERVEKSNDVSLSLYFWTLR